MSDILSSIGSLVSGALSSSTPVIKQAASLTSVAKTAATASATAAKATVDSPEMIKLKEAAKQFEAVFLRQMIGTMRKSGGGDGIFDSSATEQFRDMSDGKLADSMAEKGALHVADMLVKQYGARLAGTAAASSANGSAQ